MSGRITGTLEIELGNIRPDPSSQSYVDGKRLTAIERRLRLVTATLDAELASLRKSMLTEMVAQICLDATKESQP